MLDIYPNTNIWVWGAHIRGSDVGYIRIHTRDHVYPAAASPPGVDMSSQRQKDVLANETGE